MRGLEILIGLIFFECLVNFFLLYYVEVEYYEVECVLYLDQRMMFYFIVKNVEIVYLMNLFDEMSYLYFQIVFFL